MILTCYHVITKVEREDLRIRIPQRDGLGEMMEVRYDEKCSRPIRDAAALRSTFASAAALRNRP